MTCRSVPPHSSSWVDNEPGWADAMRELRCIRRRACKRWRLVLSITVVLTTTFAIFTSQQQRSFKSTVVLRVTERRIEPGSPLRTPRELKQYIMRVVLSRQALLAVADKFSLYPQLRAHDPGWVEQLVREAIELDVSGNEFESLEDANSPRSTQIAISFQAPDPELALSVVQHLGTFIENQQQSERRDFSSSIARYASDGVDLLQQDLRRLYQQQTELLAQSQGHASTASAEVELQHIRASIEQTERSLDFFEAQAQTLNLRSDFENQEHGLRFETLAPGNVTKSALTAQERMILHTSFAFLLLLPLVSLAVGTFGVKIRDSDGLRHLGLRPIGEVPLFEGMACGAWAHRNSTSRGTT